MVSLSVIGRITYLIGDITASCIIEILYGKVTVKSGKVFLHTIIGVKEDILIENTLSGKNISSSIVGVGLNVNTLFCGELSDIATSMLLESGKSFSVEEVTKKLTEELFKERTMEEYRAYLGFMGERATLILGDERVPATLLFVDDEGRLTAEINGERRVFSSAEVSVRIC